GREAVVRGFRPPWAPPVPLLPRPPAPPPGTAPPRRRDAGPARAAGDLPRPPRNGRVGFPARPPHHRLARGRDVPGRRPRPGPVRGARELRGRPVRRGLRGGHPGPAAGGRYRPGPPAD